MSNLANFLTGLSLAAGFLSIIFSLESHFTYAAWAIIIAVVFDGLDGQAARLSGGSGSGFGKELDSLVDAISFGIAPSILGYVFIYSHFQVWALLVLFIYLASSVGRLAKYNITPKEKMLDYFIGLPTTASGGVLASFVLIYRKKENMLVPDFMPNMFLPEFLPVVFLFLVLSLAFLMVSKVRYLNLDGLKKMLGGKTKLVILALVALLIIAGSLKKAGFIVFGFFLIYLIFSPFVVKRIHRL